MDIVEGAEKKRERLEARECVDGGGCEGAPAADPSRKTHFRRGETGQEVGGVCRSENNEEMFDISERETVLDKEDAENRCGRGSARGKSAEGMRKHRDNLKTLKKLENFEKKIQIFSRLFWEGTC